MEHKNKEFEIKANEAAVENYIKGIKEFFADLHVISCDYIEVMKINTEFCFLSEVINETGLSFISGFEDMYFIGTSNVTLMFIFRMKEQYFTTRFSHSETSYCEENQLTG